MPRIWVAFIRSWMITINFAMGVNVRLEILGKDRQPLSYV
jgi:hypothetical protein